MGFTKNVNKNGIVEFSSTPQKCDRDCHRGNLIQKRISGVDLNTLLISIPFICLNFIFDISLGIYYAHIGAVFASVSTFCFLLLTQIIVQLFSVTWYFNDGCQFHTRNIIVHLFLLQPLERYFVLFRKARTTRRQRSFGSVGVTSSRDENVTRFYELHNDVNILRLFAAHTGLLPQFCIQVYVVCATDFHCWLTVASCVLAMLTYAWIQVNYSHAMRHVYSRSDHIENQLMPHLPQLVLVAIAHIAFVISRSLALALFASCYPQYVLPVLIFHGCIMLCWVTVQRPDFASNTLEHALYVFVVSAIYMFSFFNIKEGATRYRAIAFYSLTCFENLTLLSLWYNFTLNTQIQPSAVNISLAYAVLGLFVFGSICLSLYYSCFHPNSTSLFNSNTNSYSCNDESLNENDDSECSDSPESMPDNVLYKKKPIMNNKKPDIKKPKTKSKMTKNALNKPNIKFTHVNDNHTISPIEYKNCNTEIGFEKFGQTVYHDALDGSYDPEGHQHYSIDAGDTQPVAAGPPAIVFKALDLESVHPAVGVGQIAPPHGPAPSRYRVGPATRCILEPIFADTTPPLESTRPLTSDPSLSAPSQSPVVPAAQVPQVSSSSSSAAVCEDQIHARDASDVMNRNLPDENITPDSADIEVKRVLMPELVLPHPIKHVRNAPTMPKPPKRLKVSAFRRCHYSAPTASSCVPAPVERRQQTYSEPCVKFDVGPSRVDADTQYTPKSSHRRRHHHHHNHHRRTHRCRNCGVRSESRSSSSHAIKEITNPIDEDTFVTVNDGLSVDATLYASALDEGPTPTPPMADPRDDTLDEQALDEQTLDDPTPMIW